MCCLSGPKLGCELGSGNKGKGTEGHFTQLCVLSYEVAASKLFLGSGKQGLGDRPSRVLIPTTHLTSLDQGNSLPLCLKPLVC